jgi:hypothetical protein
MTTLISYIIRAVLLIIINSIRANVLPTRAITDGMNVLTITRIARETEYVTWNAASIYIPTACSGTLPGPAEKVPDEMSYQLIE